MMPSRELSELGSLISEALDRANNESLSGPLRALSEACEAAERAWSGSNIGYHATVYIVGLRPRPTGTIFSPEWGLKDAWPTHRPDPNWINLAHQEVVSALLARANIPDLPKMHRMAGELRDILLTLKEQAISILSAALTQREDAFLSRQLRQVEALSVLTPDAAAKTMLPGGMVWTRDSTALAQGLVLAPHQTLRALCLSHENTRGELEALRRAVRLSETHLRRMEPMGTPRDGQRSNIVISHGHSIIWRDLKDFIRDRLRLPYDEFNRVPVAGVPNSIRLTQMLDGAGIAFIVLTGEDEQTDGTLHARMNVIHEAGLFQGRLGFQRGIVLLEEGCAEFSNIEGLGQIRFPRGSIRAAFEDIRAVLERENLLST
jgi:CAP12/Pycsar effector protein, TIR domain